MTETKVYVVRDFDSSNYKGQHVGVCATLDVAKELAEKYVVTYKSWTCDVWLDVDYDQSQIYRPFTVSLYNADNEAHEMIITEETLITEYVISRPIAGA